jgi:tRNA A64-2'-O-ribosylphosphate transferase
MYIQKGGPFLEPDGGQLPLPSGREPALFRFMNDGKPYKPSVHDRLRSIALDVGFVRSVADANPLLTVVPNLRCGEWYAPPELAGGRQAYFKSTDGHTGEWDFSLRRANMHLLPLIEQAGGCVLYLSPSRTPAGQLELTQAGARF